MKSLKTIGTDSSNLWPAAEFWKKYDAGEFGKPTGSASLKQIGTSGDPRTNLPPDAFWKKYGAGG